MVNNIPVNGWPQLKDLEAVQPTLDRLDKIEAWKRTVKEETFTGEEITIPNALALPARSLIASINAIQDLHGYGHPWVGGAYKNKLPMTVSGIKALNTDGTWSGNDYTFNGVKFTILTDSANNVIGISANGTTSANHVMLKLGQLTLQGGIGYTLTGCPSGGSLDGYRLSNWGSNTVDVNDLGSGTTITVSNDELYTLMIYIRNSGIVLSNKIFYPMLRLATESDPTFAPYSNICPISGRTEARVDDTGLNQFDKDHVSSFAGFIDTATSTYKSNSSYKLCYIPCDGNTTYTISKVAGKTFRVASSVGIPVADVPFINTAANHAGTTLTFTTAADAHYLAVLYWSSANGDTLTPEQIEATLQIEIGSTATPYEPYAHSSATIQLGQTVYGADINWDTGVMTVKTALVDLGTLTYTQNGTAQSGKYRYSATITGIKPNTQAGATPNIISSQYKAETPNDSYSAVDGITVVNSDIYIYDSTKNTMSVADFKTAMNGVTAEYELATPIELTLTPTELQMLKGYNRVTLSDGYGTIELKALTGANWS